MSWPNEFNHWGYRTHAAEFAPLCGHHYIYATEVCEGQHIAHVRLSGGATPWFYASYPGVCLKRNINNWQLARHIQTIKSEIRSEIKTMQFNKNHPLGLDYIHYMRSMSWPNELNHWGYRTHAADWFRTFVWAPLYLCHRSMRGSTHCPRAPQRGCHPLILRVLSRSLFKKKYK